MAEPRDDSVRAAVDCTHMSHMAVLLANVQLVNTDSVDPEESIREVLDLRNIAEEGVQIRSDLEILAVHQDCDMRVAGAPHVRQGDIVGRRDMMSLNPAADATIVMKRVDLDQAHSTCRSIQWFIAERVPVLRGSWMLCIGPTALDP